MALLGAATVTVVAIVALLNANPEGPVFPWIIRLYCLFWAWEIGLRVDHVVALVYWVMELIPNA